MESDIRFERYVLTAILQLAVDDCLTGRGLEESPAIAYLWILHSKECSLYCELLDIDYQQFCGRVIRLAGERCERAVRSRREYAAEQLAYWRKTGRAKREWWSGVKPQKHSRAKPKQAVRHALDTAWPMSNPEKDATISAGRCAQSEREAA
jgi:hypothetical protein